jgi:hypothetical protein
MSAFQPFQATRSKVQKTILDINAEDGKRPALLRCASRWTSAYLFIDEMLRCSGAEQVGGETALWI